MVKAIFTKRFDATDTTKGVSMRLHPKDEPQSAPAWAADQAVAAGAATRVDAEIATPSKK